MNVDELNLLSGRIKEAAIEVHRTLGPGLLESAYHTALLYELNKQGMNAKSEVEIPIVYKGVRLPTSFRADIIVEDEIILELKATEKNTPVFFKQLLTYLKLSNKRLGLLLNFNQERLIDGLERIVNNL